MNHEMVLNILLEKIRYIIPDLEGRSIQSSDSLKLMGVNSIDRVDILVETMDELDISLPLTKFSNAKNIGELAEIMLQEKEI
ncbi:MULTISPECIES: acyl carrier protein [Enterobacter cloacae complex]|uniref:acyl carrier protein n=1 Tax=Enterobacter cloacae complex TaxID=354276 RepID=UPI0007962662|nr:acyl carrier protein [Enterobacter ludwigii]WNI43107.1 acyl carrier protein [Enterobacter ludwigii]WNI52144.1 acyl carrier protein [Enterobacter ludwigii]WNI83934.1 acyl carrier protein [Enterobacter ludwigii]SAC79496.1 ACP-II [Enterobacter ludwigii]